MPTATTPNRRNVVAGRRHAVIAACVGLNDAGVDRKTLTLDQARVHARTNHSFEHLAQDITVAEAAMTIDRKCRMIRNLVVEIETAKPAVRKVKCDLFVFDPGLRGPYRAGASFLMNSNTASLLDQLKDGNGQFLPQHLLLHRPRCVERVSAKSEQEIALIDLPGRADHDG